MQDYLQRVWYSKNRPGLGLIGMSLLFAALVGLRRRLYRAGILPTRKLPRPVIVVGNLTVGGTGKTPLVLWLAAALRARGLRPGIISRGYGVKAKHARRVSALDSADQVGDEPHLLARRSQVPVAVGADRVAAARLLVGEVDVLISDDGLQHYRLARDLEIVVIDGARGLGNGWWLPAGPLREDRRRLGQVDFVVSNGAGGPSGAIRMDLRPSAVVRLSDGRREPLSLWSGRCVHAAAGIGHPQRFFDALKVAGLKILPHALADHVTFKGAELSFGDGLPVLMTEKDAVKYQRWATPLHWYVEVEAELASADAERLLDAVDALFLARRKGLRTLNGG